MFTFIRGKLNSLDISVVIPVYNSEKTLSELSQRLKKALGQIDLSFEIIFVDDASIDVSWDVLKSICVMDDCFKAIKLSKNSGVFKATSAGLSVCKGNYIVTMDDDLEQLPEDIILLINELRTNDTQVVFGVSGLKRERSIVYPYRNFIQNILAGQSNTESYRAFRREFISDKGWHIDAYIKLFADPLKIKEVLVRHTTNKNKTRVYSFFKKLILFVSSIPFFSLNPFRFPAIVLFFSFLLCITSYHPLWLLVVMLAALSIILLSGQYVSLILRKLSDIPDFIIIERVNL